jgi:ABC-type glycerol-3-phosphate transport system permease component
MKTAIIIIAELVRSLVLSGLAAAGIMLIAVAASATTGYCLWRLWVRVRR